MSISEEQVKTFVMSNVLAESALDEVEVAFALDLGRGIKSANAGTDARYYPQIEQAVRTEASSMAPHYELFYSLEKTIRIQIGESLLAQEGKDWWDSDRVPSAVRSAAESTRARERDNGGTLRSDDLIDYCTFGELGELIRSNWDVFGGMFTSPKAVIKVMAQLNSLRGPIAHCSKLADDEVLRLHLAMRDWFRLSESQ